MSGSNVTAVISHSDISAFAESNVNLPSAKVAEYRARVTALKETLEAKIKADPAYAVVRALQAGSLAKGTALRTASDFDLALYLRPDKAPTDERDLLPWMIERLKEARPQLDDDQFKTKDHCVCITYRDGREVDVVPVLDAGSGNGDGDLIRKDTGEPVRTNIPRHIDFIRRRKARLPIHFRQGIRLVKWWAEQLKREDDSFRFKSYLSELVCAHLLDHGNVDFTSYPDMLMGVFAYITRTGLTEPIVFEDYYKASAVPSSAMGVMTVIDAVNSANNVVSDYTETDRKAIVTAASGALDAIADAEYTPYADQSVSDWQKVLGRQFRGQTR
jgi:hypothetical protein